MQPYVGEIRLTAFTKVPTGWFLCDGSALPTDENAQLFAAIGITYGGDGVSQFNLPDLRGRAPMHLSPAWPLGSAGGEDAVALTPEQLPAHVHQLYASTREGSDAAPTNATFAASAELNQYEPTATAATGNMLREFGDSAAHNNLMPFLAMNYIISAVGTMPKAAPVA